MESCGRFLNTRDIAAVKPGSFLDVTLGQTLLLTERTQLVADNHHMASSSFSSALAWLNTDAWVIF
jgi:hypothetical protein